MLYIVSYLLFMLIGFLFIGANGKLYVVGAEFEERFCRPTKMLEKGAEATNFSSSPYCNIQIVTSS